MSYRRSRAVDDGNVVTGCFFEWLRLLVSRLGVSFASSCPPWRMDHLDGFTSPSGQRVVDVAFAGHRCINASGVTGGKEGSTRKPRFPCLSKSGPGFNLLLNSNSTRLSTANT